MRRRPAQQLGFDALLGAAKADDEARKFARQAAHLPSTMEQAIPYFRLLLRQHHAAMLVANVDETMRLRQEARLLARRLNKGDPGILAGDESSGNVLARETAAPRNAIPLWGQEGDFLITVGAMRVRVVMDGVFGITGSIFYWPSFAAHAVDQERPYLSETGFRSFLGCGADPVPQFTADEFARKVIQTYVKQEIKGKLPLIKPEYRETEEGA